MDNPIKITATRSVWLSPHDKPASLLDAVSRGNHAAVCDMLTIYGNTDRESFCDYAKVGTAEVTIHLLPADQQTRAAVAALQAKLEQERAEWLRKQAAILAEISKLQALTYEAA